MLDQLKLMGIHYHISDNTRAFISEKLSKFDYLKQLMVHGEIRIIREAHFFKIEGDFHLKRNHTIHFETTHDMLYPAIENFTHKLKNILSSEHKKIASHKHHHAPHKNGKAMNSDS